MNRGQRAALVVGAVTLAVALHVLFVNWEAAERSQFEPTVVEQALIDLLAQRVGVEIIFQFSLGEITIFALTKGGSGRTSAILLGLVAPVALVVGAQLLGGTGRRREGPPAGGSSTTGVVVADERGGAGLSPAIANLRAHWRWMRYPVMALAALLATAAIVFAWLQITA